MMFPSKEIVEMLRKQYPVGSRVELVRMDDFQAPPIGTLGTVKGVDDAGSILVSWDNGCGLNVVYGEDECRKLDTAKVICNGKEKVWDSRKDALSFYLRAIVCSQGNECRRYTKIYAELLSEFEVCSDE